MVLQGAVVIDWLDHYVDPAETAWVPLDDMKPAPVLVRTIGFVVKETDEIITIGHTHHEDEAIGVFHILRDTIIQVKALRLPKLAAGAMKRRPFSKQRSAP